RAETRAPTRHGAAAYARSSTGGGCCAAPAAWFDRSDAPGRVERGDAASEIAERHLREAMLRNDPGKLLLHRESADALDQILIGLAVAGHYLAERRTDAEGIEVIEPRQRRQRDMTELQAQEAAARLQHAPRLGQGARDAGDVAQAEGDRVGIERPVRERQRLGAATDPLQAGDDAPVDGAGAANLEHSPRQVADDDARPGAAARLPPPENAAGRRGGAASRL